MEGGGEGGRENVESLMIFKDLALTLEGSLQNVITFCVWRYIMVILIS